MEAGGGQVERKSEMDRAVRDTVGHARKMVAGIAAGDQTRADRLLKIQGQVLILAGLKLMDDGGAG